MRETLFWNKTQQMGFTQVPNKILNDKELSLGAKGLWSYMAGKPEGWVFTIKLITSQCKESETAVTSKLNELLELGYVKREIIMTKNGKQCFYSIFAEPNLENPNLENPNLEKPNLENQGLVYSNKELSNKEVSKKELEIIKKKRFIKPTIEEIQARCDEMGYDIDAESFFNYYESKGWVVGKTPMKNWRAALAGWNARNNKKSQVKHTTNSLVGFELWEEIMGAPMALTRENVSASEKLVQENGKDGLRNIILLARECKKDSRADYRASHIANLNDLLRNWEYLVDWARQKGIGGKSEAEEELENFNNTY